MCFQSNDAELLKFKGGVDFVGPDRDANIGFFVQQGVQPVSMPGWGGGGCTEWSLWEEEGYSKYSTVRRKRPNKTCVRLEATCLVCPAGLGLL